MDEIKEKSSLNVEPTLNKNEKYKKVILSMTILLQYSYNFIPLIYAVYLLLVIAEFKKIPELESSLFEPGFTIGLYFVILASIGGMMALFWFKVDMKNLKNEVAQIKKDLYNLSEKEEFQKIEESPKKLSFSLLKKLKEIIGNPIKDYNDWKNTREIFTKSRTYIYIIIVCASLFFIHLAGQSLAENIAPKAQIYNYTSQMDPNYDLKDFEIEYTVKNIDQIGFDLMKPTEYLQFDIKIKNNSPNDVSLKFSATTYVGSNYIRNNEITEPIVIKQNQNYEFSRGVYLEDVGINSFYLNFEFEKYQDNNRAYGSMEELNERIVGEIQLQFRKNVISQADYDTKIQQYFVYYYLAVVSSPLVFIGVKSFKEIIEDKNDS